MCKISYFYFLLILLNLLNIVFAQKCTPQYTDDNELDFVRCLNVGSMQEISSEMDASWNKIVVVNKNLAKFLLAEHEQTHLHTIELLDLAKAGTLQVSDHGFRDFEVLNNLNISNTKISLFKTNWVQRTNIIEFLDISRNELTTINRENIRIFNKLKFGNLSYNSIGLVEKNAFIDLKRLETLLLHNNRIEELDFGEITILKNLNLRDNLLSVIKTGTFQRMPQLEKLNLAQNNIVQLEERSFVGIGTNIKVLNISGNSLKVISPLTFVGLERARMTDLDLNQNDIQTISVNAFIELKLLVSLDLSQNSLTELDQETFKGLTNLRKLNLFSNDILNIQINTFNSVPNLDQLDLSNNRIESISGDIWGNSGSRLKRLILSGNNIKFLQPDLFKNTVHLDYLDASYNELTILDKNLFVPLVKIRKIILSNNLITEFSSELMDSISSISELNFSYNKITFFPNVHVGYPKLTKLGLEGNPWQCPCLNEIINYSISQNVDYKKKGFTDGTAPICVVTPTTACVKNINLVREHQIVEIFEAAYSVTSANFDV